MKCGRAVVIAALLTLVASGVWAGSGAGLGAVMGGMDLKKYDVRFNSLDVSGDDALSWEEYNTHFKDSDRKIFDALDTDGTGLVERKEWHNFKAAHGMAGPAEGGKGKYHPTELPDPAAYMIPMGEIDKDGNDALTWEEFQGRFPDADKSAYEAIDMNRDASISQDEWREFKAAHGSKE